MTNEQAILRAILQTLGRQRFTADQLRAEIAPVGDGRKQIAAYNMCDGVSSQADIAKALSMDRGQLSRTISRWVENGWAFRLGEGTEQRILHLFPLPADAGKEKGK